MTTQSETSQILKGVWNAYTRRQRERVRSTGEFGLNTDFVGMPMDVAKSQFAVEIIDKTDRYEPRATVKDINFSFNEDGQLQAEVVITNV